MESYDEDLTENEWYIALCQKHDDIFQRASSERWMICIPRKGTWKAEIEDGDLFSQKYFESHILKPVVLYSHDDTESLPQNKYVTFNGKEVVIEGSTILCGSGFVNKHQKPSYDSRSETLDLQLQECHSAQILFEETFFNQNDESYIVVCISQPLEQDLVLQRSKISDNDATEPDVPVPMWESYGSFIWSKATNPARVQSIVNEKIVHFTNDMKNLPYSYTAMSRNTEACSKELQSLSSRVLKLISACFHLLQRDFKLRKFCESQPELDDLKSALESYIQYGVFECIMSNLNDLFSSQDCILNKITRNLQAVRLSDLGIHEQFRSGVPRARRELSLLNHFRTPKEKLSCLHKVVMYLSQQSAFSYSGNGHPSSPSLKTKRHESVNSGMNMSSQAHEPMVMSSDDLLPILIYLVIKCDIAHWFANISYLKHFNFVASSQDRLGFYLATLEAAVEHIRNGSLSFDRTQVKSLRQNSSDNAEQVSHLFKLVSAGDASAIRQFLRQADAMQKLQEHDKCHPLCECSKCVKLTASGKQDKSSYDVGVMSRDEQGRSALHIAAIVGKHEIVDALMERGAELNACDYHGSTPLHLAAQEGSQSVIFLLLHHGANANAEDNNNNTALHLACLGGHDACVKALLYFDPTVVVVKINAVNEAGDTPLHLAARWGYGNIALALMEYEADPNIKNRRQLTPRDVTHNSEIIRILELTAVELGNVTRYQEPPPIKKPGKNSRIGLEVDRAPPAGTKVGRSRGLSSTTSGADDGTDQVSKEIDKLLRAVTDNDLNMVIFLCGWTAADQTQDVAAEKCHPLCQCTKCSPAIKDPILHANVMGPDGASPLMIASKLGYVDIVRVLLQHNAKTDLKLRSKGHTPLHLACQYGHSEIVEMLLQRGAYYDIRDNDGSTPIFMCSMNGHNACIEMLIKHGASVNIRNRKGLSPLHEAVKWKHTATVRILVEHGAMVYYKNNAGMTPLDMSEQEPDIHGILLQVAKRQQSADTLSSSGIRHKDTKPINQIDPDRLSRKSMSQSEADEALADDLFNQFSTPATPSTPPLFDVTSNRSLPFDDVINDVENEADVEKSSLTLFESVLAKIPVPDERKSMASDASGSGTSSPTKPTCSSPRSCRSDYSGSTADTDHRKIVESDDGGTQSSIDADIGSSVQKPWSTSDTTAPDRPSVEPASGTRKALSEKSTPSEPSFPINLDSELRAGNEALADDTKLEQAAHHPSESTDDAGQIATDSTAGPAMVSKTETTACGPNPYFEIAPTLTADALNSVCDVTAKERAASSSSTCDVKDSPYLAFVSKSASNE